jgi:hypothetical protein
MTALLLTKSCHITNSTQTIMLSAVLLTTRKWFVNLHPRLLLDSWRVFAGANSDHFKQTNSKLTTCESSRWYPKYIVPVGCRVFSLGKPSHYI